VNVSARSFTNVSTDNIIQFNGLPFTSNSNSISTGALLMAYVNTLNSTVAVIFGGETSIKLYRYASGGDYSSLNHDAITSTSSSRRIFISMTYRT
jgi:hypothetical protein